ncbi:hypothetical protein IWQ61_000403 [Dispira simplex]|nr:hypothetical protein IWQ61_000403 [Dispira simplex]
MVSQVIVYGGCGGLGSALVSLFKSKSWRVISVDLRSNPEADANIPVDINLSFEAQAQQAISLLSQSVTTPVDAVLCVAGGWAGGSVVSSEVFSSTELMWKQSVQSSLVAAHIASKHLKSDGMLTLTGALAAQEGTPGMIGYGLAKAAVHQLTASLAAPSSGLPSSANVNAILPVTLDTPANRQGMPQADFSSWTPLNIVAEKLFAWANNQDRPASGSLVSIVTKDNHTTFA